MHDEHELNRVEVTAVGPDGRTLAIVRSVREGAKFVAGSSSGMWPRGAPPTDTRAALSVDRSGL